MYVCMYIYIYIYINYRLRERASDVTHRPPQRGVRKGGIPERRPRCPVCTETLFDM